MAIYDIVNPSDPYTMVSEERLDAALAVILIGNGHYPLDELGSSWHVPAFLFCGVEGVEAWLMKEFQEPSLDEALEKRTPFLAGVLDSVLIGNPGERSTFEEALKAISDDEAREAYRAKVHDQRRSSLNDIGSRARSLARSIRAKAAEEASA